LGGDGGGGEISPSGDFKSFLKSFLVVKFPKKKSSKRNHQVPSGSKKYRRMVNFFKKIQIFLLPNLTKSILNNCHFSNITNLKKKKTLVTTTPLRKGSPIMLGCWCMINNCD
jgi:hypothetical protein